MSLSTALQPKAAPRQEEASPVPALPALTLQKIPANNFDFLRLLLAVLVILSHSFALVSKSNSEPLYYVTKGQDTFGTFAVDCFFAISGFLVMHSLLRSKSPLDFLKKRILRIYPAFIVATIVGVTVFIPLALGSFPRIFNGRFLLHMIRSCFMLRRVELFEWFETSPLPTLFPNSAFRDVLNGSMWTIPFEFGCYMLLALLGFLCLRRTRVGGFVLMSILIVGLYAAHLKWVEGLNPIDWPNGWSGRYVVLFVAILPLIALFIAGAVCLNRYRVAGIIMLTVSMALILVVWVLVVFTFKGWLQIPPIAPRAKYDVQQYLTFFFGRLPPWPRFLTYFFMGCMLYYMHRWIPYSLIGAAIALGIMCMVAQHPRGPNAYLPSFLHSRVWFLVLKTFLVPYILFSLAFSKYIPLRGFAKYGDFSYGTYLYAFPIQQLLIQRFPGFGPLAIFFIATPLSIFCGGLSWHLVEKWFLRLKGPPVQLQPRS